MNNSAANLSIIIANFNSGEYLLRCLESLKKSKDEVSIDVFVVDNASSDESLKNVKNKFPEINYIENKENLGFGKANNIALKKVNTPYVLFLNPDTQVDRGTIPFLIKFMEEDKKIGAVTCKVVLEDGSLDWASHRAFPNPLVALSYALNIDRFYHKTSEDLTKVHEVDVISGAFFLTRKSILDKIGGFDEDYFMYGEDIDLCFRIKKAGYKIMFVPSVKIIHHKGISSGLKEHSQNKTTADIETRKRALDNFYQTKKIFYKKHYQKKYPSFVGWLVNFGIDLMWSRAKRKMVV